MSDSVQNMLSQLQPVQMHDSSDDDDTDTTSLAGMSEVSLRENPFDLLNEADRELVTAVVEEHCSAEQIEKKLDTAFASHLDDIFSLPTQLVSEFDTGNESESEVRKAVEARQAERRKHLREAGGVRATFSVAHTPGGPSPSLLRGTSGFRSQIRGRVDMHAVQLKALSRDIVKKKSKSARARALSLSSIHSSSKSVNEPRRRMMRRKKATQMNRKLREKQERRMRNLKESQEQNPMRVETVDGHKFSLTEGYLTESVLVGGPSTQDDYRQLARLSTTFSAHEESERERGREKERGGKRVSIIDSKEKLMKHTNLTSTETSLGRGRKRRTTGKGNGREKGRPKSSTSRPATSSTSAFLQQTQIRNAPSSSYVDLESDTEANGSGGDGERRGESDQEKERKREIERERELIGDSDMDDFNPTATFLTGLDVEFQSSDVSCREDIRTLSSLLSHLPSRLSEGPVCPTFTSSKATAASLMQLTASTIPFVSQRDRSTWVEHFTSSQSRSIVYDTYWYMLLKEGVEVSGTLDTNPSNDTGALGAAVPLSRKGGPLRGSEREREKLLTTLLHRISDAFFVLFMKVEREVRDDFLSHFFDGVSQSVFYFLSEACPDSFQSIEAPQFKMKLLQTTGEWVLGECCIRVLLCCFLCHLSLSLSVSLCLNFLVLTLSNSLPPHHTAVHHTIQDMCPPLPTSSIGRILTTNADRNTTHVKGSPSRISREWDPRRRGLREH